MVAIYSVASAEKHGSEIRAQVSRDGGASWMPPVPVNDDHTKGPHGWISTATDASGRIQVAWLDGRSGEQSLVWTRTGDGLHFEPNRVLDSRVCFCCATALAADRGGRSWIAYRDLEGKDLRNITVVAGDPNGGFRAPAVVSDDGWRIDGCPDSGPRLAVSEGVGLWAIWFNGAAPGVFSAFSPGANPFSGAVRVAGPSSDGGIPNHPDIAVLPDGRVIAVYVRKSRIFGTELTPANARGTWSEAVLLAEPGVEPRIVVGGGRKALACTARSGNELIAVAETNSLERRFPPER